MAFSMIEGRWVYGPLGFTDGHGDLKPVSFTASQQIVLMRRFRVIGVTRLLANPGIWVGPPCTRQCRHAFARTRPLPPDRHTPSDRRGPFAQRGTSRLKRYNMSDLRGLTRHVGHFSRGLQWRTTGGTYGMAGDGRGSVCSILPTITRPSTATPQVPPDIRQPGNGCVRGCRLTVGRRHCIAVMLSMGPGARAGWGVPRWPCGCPRVTGTPGNRPGGM